MKIGGILYFYFYGRVIIWESASFGIRALISTEKREESTAERERKREKRTACAVFVSFQFKFKVEKTRQTETRREEIKSGKYGGLSNRSASPPMLLLNVVNSIHCCRRKEGRKEGRELDEFSSSRALTGSVCLTWVLFFLVRLYPKYYL